MVGRVQGVWVVKFHYFFSTLPFSESWVPYDWEQPPAITVVAWRSNVEKGWKNNILTKNLNQNCVISQNFTMLIECFNRQTFNLSEILDQVNNGDRLKQDITNNLSWNEDLGNFDLGKAYTLNNSYQIGIDTKRFEIFFKKDLNYTIWIHDPNYYIYTHNPGTVPKGSLEISNMIKLFSTMEVRKIIKLRILKTI